MVDLHSHVLHGVDDGAATLDESLAMLKQAAETGTTDIVATPHSASVDELGEEAISERLEELRQRTASWIRIHKGVEYLLTYNNFVRLMGGQAGVAINGDGYVLVEVPPLVPAQPSEEMLRQLIDGGITVILAHPERNPGLARERERLVRLVERGLFLQVTAMSVTGGFGRQIQSCAEWLLDRGLVHFVASDGHDPERRPTRMNSAYDTVLRLYDGEYAELLFTSNPLAVVKGWVLERGAVVVRKRGVNPFKWFQLRSRRY